MSRRRHTEPDMPFLVCDICRTVRFEEIDAMGVVWHGRYPGWLEDGREALNSRYNITYLRFQEHGVAIPVRVMHIDYLKPLVYPQTYTIRTRLLWQEAARIDFAYSILDAEGAIMTEACTTQLMVNPDGALLLEPPPFFAEFKRRWQNGDVQ